LGLTGPGTATTTFNPGAAFGIALGYRLALGLRTEAELGYLHFAVDAVAPLSTDGAIPAFDGTRAHAQSGGERDRFTATVNLFYDLPVTFAGLTPYLGGGVGYYHASGSDAVFVTRSGGRFAGLATKADNALLLAEVGASYALTPRLSLVPAYRYGYYFGTTAARGSANTLKLALRYTF
jgi:opacity protein-like surface antigen